MALTTVSAPTHKAINKGPYSQKRVGALCYGLVSCRVPSGMDVVDAGADTAFEVDGGGLLAGAAHSLADDAL